MTRDHADRLPTRKVPSQNADTSNLAAFLPFNDHDTLALELEPISTEPNFMEPISSADSFPAPVATSAEFRVPSESDPAGPSDMARVTTPPPGSQCQSSANRVTIMTLLYAIISVP